MSDIVAAMLESEARLTSLKREAENEVASTHPLVESRIAGCNGICGRLSVKRGDVKRRVHTQPDEISGVEANNDIEVFWGRGERVHIVAGRICGEGDLR